MQTFRNQTVFLPGLAQYNGMVAGLTFENCVIRGPAVVILLSDTIFDGVTYGLPDSDIEAILWEFPADAIKVGAIGLQGCSFIGGRTEGIGFAGSSGDLDMIRRSVDAN